MKRDTKKSSRQARSIVVSKPLHLFIIMVVSIFVTEAIVMFALSLLPPLPVYQIALLDGFLLILIAFPLIYLFVLKPYITERKRMDERLYILSITDELTGLYNRRGFLTLAKHQLKVADRHKKGMLLLFADLDNMKIINDTLGHDVGDSALKDAAKICRDTFRDSDVLARLGGDEFVLLSMESPDVSADSLSVRLRASLSAYNTEEKRPFNLQLSVGIVRYKPESPCSIEALLSQADKVMYEEKKERVTTQGYKDGAKVVKSLILIFEHDDESVSVSMSMTDICFAQMSTASRNMLKKDQSEASNRFFRSPCKRHP